MPIHTLSSASSSTASLVTTSTLDSQDGSFRARTPTGRRPGQNRLLLSPTGSSRSSVAPPSSLASFATDESSSTASTSQRQQTFTVTQSSRRQFSWVKPHTMQLIANNTATFWDFQKMVHPSAGGNGNGNSSAMFNLTTFLRAWNAYSSIRVQHAEDPELAAELHAFAEQVIDFDDKFRWSKVREYIKEILTRRMGKPMPQGDSWHQPDLCAMMKILDL